MVSGLGTRLLSMQGLVTGNVLRQQCWKNNMSRFFQLIGDLAAVHQMDHGLIDLFFPWMITVGQRSFFPRFGGNESLLTGTLPSNMFGYL